MQASVVISTIAFAASSSAQSSVVSLRGRVSFESGRGIGNAVVSAYVDGFWIGSANSGVDGAYVVRCPRQQGVIVVVARLAWYVTKAAQVSVATSDSSVSVPGIVLARSPDAPTNASQLAAMRVVASRLRPTRDASGTSAGPGEARTILDGTSFLQGDLSGDVRGDPLLALAAIPGLVTTTGTDGLPSYSLAGLGADQNRLTINGADFTGDAPRDAGLLRVSTATYDAARSASGAQTDIVLVSGTYTPARLLHLTYDSPLLQWTTATTDRLGGRTSLPIISGRLAGPSNHLATLYATSFQASRQVSPVSSLAGADPATLTAIGINPDSARRLLSSLGALGINPGAERSGDARITTTANISTRLDFTNSSLVRVLPNASGVSRIYPGDGAGRISYVIVGGNWKESEGISIGPSTLPMHSSDSRVVGATVQAFNSQYVHESILNETRSTLSLQDSRFAPASSLPNATVIMTSTAQDGSLTSSSIAAAGTGESKASSSLRSWQTSNETRFTNPSGRHELKLALEMTFQQLSTNHGEAGGSYLFNSLADFTTNNAVSFFRTTSDSKSAIERAAGAIGVGDAFAVNRALTIQYGLRLEGQRMRGGGGPASVESVFAGVAGTTLSTLASSPMIGFTWNYGARNEQGVPRGGRSLIGGIRDFRGVASVQRLEPYFRNSGANVGGQILCVGAAVPGPDWALFEASPSSIPQRCADGTQGTAFSQTAPVLRMVDPLYSPSHSWRPELKWTTPLADHLVFSLHGASAFNSALPETVDLNFNGVSRFTLAQDDNRPVFATAGNIVPATGATTLTDSRRSAAYAQVNVLRSGLQSRSNTLTAAIDYQPQMLRYGSTLKLPLAASYTLSDLREEVDGFAGTTDGDPRAHYWRAGTFSRHAAILSTYLRSPDGWLLSVGLQLSSGQPFTPRIAGDINGDGLQNDRAFIADPSRTADTALARGMSQLLASSSGRVRDCLVSQLGTIAADNSCRNGWAATLNSSLVLSPYTLGLQNRGTIRLAFTNLLAGLDQLLHSSSSLRGWGQPSFVDQTLLTVRGFDPSARRFNYSVNPHFGTPGVFGNVYRSPFRITLDVKLDVGPDRERIAMLGQFGERSEPLDSAAVYSHLRGRANALFAPVLDSRERFALTDAQVSAIARIGDQYGATRDSILACLASYVASRHGDVDNSDTQEKWHAAMRAIIWAEWLTAGPLRAVLSEEQAAAVFSRVGPLSTKRVIMEKTEVERYLHVWLLSY